MLFAVSVNVLQIYINRVNRTPKITRLHSRHYISFSDFQILFYVNINQHKTSFPTMSNMPIFEQFDFLSHCDVIDLMSFPVSDKEGTRCGLIDEHFMITYRQ